MKSSGIAFAVAIPLWLILIIVAFFAYMHFKGNAA